jgi:histidinol-phosphate aminotransferase
VRLRPEIAALPAYKQGRPAAAGGYKLSSNENPFPPLPGVLEAVIAAAAEVNRYPDGSAAAVRERLAARHGVTADEVHVGAGSVSLLAQFLSAAAGPGDEVVYAWRSFEAYPGLVTVAGATSVRIPLLPDGRHDLRAMAAAVTERTRVVLVCSPNNPTGCIVERAEFAEFLAAVPSDVLVLLDEAYAEFVRDAHAVDGMDLLGTPNLVVLRTFSKAWGLAGLRLGYAVGPSRVLDAARAAAIPLSVTSAAQVAAIAALDAEDEATARVEELVRRRDRVQAGLTAAGLSVPVSEGNFVWLGLADATESAAELLHEAGLSARVFPGEGIRVSIGEEESVGRLLTAADEIVRFLSEGSPGRR